MKNFQENIDKLVSKILNEEIESRVKHISETKGQWEEIERLNKELDKIEAAITRYIKQMDREELEQ